MSSATDKLEHAMFLAAAAADEYGAESGEKVFAPLDASFFPSQIFWTLLSFIVLYFILSRIFLPRVGETIEDRGSRIADDIDSASRMQREAEEAEKAYTQALADARAKAMNVAETTKQSIDAEVQVELEAADEEAKRHADAADARIQELRLAALSNIETIASEAAQDVVTALTGKKVTLAAVKSALN
jgi:F-type H+-transporting ATPase subunit b